MITAEIDENRGDVRRDGKAGLGDQEKLGSDEGEADPRSKEHGFGGEQVLPLIRPGNPELAVPNQRLSVDDARNQQPPTSGNDEREQWQQILSELMVNFPAGWKDQAQGQVRSNREQYFRPEAAGIFAEDVQDLVHG